MNLSKASHSPEDKLPPKTMESVMHKSEEPWDMKTELNRENLTKLKELST